MGYIPPKQPLDFGRATATLYTIARIADLGNQFLAQSEHAARRRDVPPRTYEEYVARLYGDRPRDWMPLFSYGLLTAIIAAVVLIVLAVVK